MAGMPVEIAEEELPPRDEVATPPPVCEADPETVEVCDGRDDDCDGNIDEGVSNTCGTCELFVRERRCTAGDEDCDGRSDEMFDDPQAVVRGDVIFEHRVDFHSPVLSSDGNDRVRPYFAATVANPERDPAAGAGDEWRNIDRIVFGPLSNDASLFHILALAPGESAFEEPENRYLRPVHLATGDGLHFDLFVEFGEKSMNDGQHGPVEGFRVYRFRYSAEGGSQGVSELSIFSFSDAIFESALTSRERTHILVKRDPGFQRQWYYYSLPRETLVNGARLPDGVITRNEQTCNLNFAGNGEIAGSFLTKLGAENLDDEVHDGALVWANAERTEVEAWVGRADGLLRGYTPPLQAPQTPFDIAQCAIAPLEAAWTYDDYEFQFTSFRAVSVLEGPGAGLYFAYERPDAAGPHVDRLFSAGGRAQDGGAFDPAFNTYRADYSVSDYQLVALGLSGPVAFSTVQPGSTPETVNYGMVKVALLGAEGKTAGEYVVGLKPGLRKAAISEGDLGAREGDAETTQYFTLWSSTNPESTDDRAGLTMSSGFVCQ